MLKDAEKAEAYKGLCLQSASLTNMLYAELYYINGVLINTRIEPRLKQKWVELESEVIEELQRSRIEGLKRP